MTVLACRMWDREGPETYANKRKRPNKTIACVRVARSFRCSLVVRASRGVRRPSGIVEMLSKRRRCCSYVPWYQRIANACTRAKYPQAESVLKIGIKKTKCGAGDIINRTLRYFLSRAVAKAFAQTLHSKSPSSLIRRKNVRNGGLGEWAKEDP